MSLVTAPAIDLGPGKGKGIVPIGGRDLVRFGQVDGDPLGRPFIVLRRKSAIMRVVAAQVGAASLGRVSLSIHVTQLFKEILNLRNAAQAQYVSYDDEDGCAGGGDASEDDGTDTSAGASADGTDASAMASANDNASDSSDDAGCVPPPRAPRRLNRAEDVRAKKRRRMRRLARELSMPSTISVTLSREDADDCTFDVMTRSQLKASPAIELNQHNLDMLSQTIIGDYRRDCHRSQLLPRIDRKTAASGYNYCYRSQRWYHYGDEVEAGSNKKRRLFLDRGANPPRATNTEAV